MKSIDKSIVKLIDEDLMSFIVEDTRKLVLEMKELVSKNNTQVFSEFDRTWEISQNVIELYFMYFYSVDSTPKCDLEVASLTSELCDFNRAIYKEFGLNEENDSNYPKIAEELGDFILTSGADKSFKRNYYFTSEDIEAYKKKMKFKNNT